MSFIPLPRICISPVLSSPALLLCTCICFALLMLSYPLYGHLLYCFFEEKTKKTRLFTLVNDYACSSLSDYGYDSMSSFALPLCAPSDFRTTRPYIYEEVAVVHVESRYLSRHTTTFHQTFVRFAPHQSLLYISYRKWIAPLAPALRPHLLLPTHMNDSLPRTRVARLCGNLPRPPSSSHGPRFLIVLLL
ncbi:hypothetical protein H4582DRAFT_1240423 [Lactarius indigo]|nr:hypothetical protein H4582DRAFT_1240423 [Lactarius indigo]